MQERSDISRCGKVNARAMFRYGSVIAIIALVIFFLLQCVRSALGPFSPDPETYNNQIAPKQAKTLYRALNKYFGDHNEYPDQVLGGCRYIWARSGDGSYVLDPLLEGGYLWRYPKVNDYTRNVVLTPDPRGIEIKNLVSAPHDLFVEWLFREHKPVDPSAHTIWKDEEYRRERMKEYEQIMGDYEERLKLWSKLMEEGVVVLVAGGVEQERRTDSRYSVIPDAIRRQMNSLLWPSMRKEGLMDERPEGIPVNFGYVRGERMGSDEKSAHLWMYGMLPDQDRHYGLDVLNAETGELVPDGIPDAVVLLYELRDGKVVNVTRAEDM